MKRGLRLMVSILLSIFLSISINADDNNPGPKSAVKIFDNNIVHFTPDDSSKYNTGKIFALDKGRLIFTKINFRPYDSSMKITAHLQIYPIPKDDIAVYDPWDRAGNIRLVKDNMPDIEIIKFITAYGGYTEYKVDITHLAPLLRDSCTIECFIDTWMTPGWKVDFDIIFEPQSDIITPDWAQGIMYTDSYNKKEHGGRGS